MVDGDNMQLHLNKFNELQKVSAVYTPVRLLCVLFRQNYFLVGAAVYNKVRKLRKHQVIMKNFALVSWNIHI